MELLEGLEAEAGKGGGKGGHGKASELRAAAFSCLKWDPEIEREFDDYVQ